MGRKVHPVGFRLGIIKDWQARWYAEKGYQDLLHEDFRLRKMVKERLADAAIALVEVERSANQVSVTIHTAKPGIVIGRGGQKVEELRQGLERDLGKKVRLNIQEIRQPEMHAVLVAKSVAEQLEKRVAYKRALKQTIMRTMRLGAKGIKIEVAGRLGGVGDEAAGMGQVGARARCRPSAPTLTTVRPRRTRPLVASASRPGSTRARSCRRRSGFRPPAAAAGG